MSRRGFLKAAIAVAPAVILTPGLLMKVRPYGVSPTASALDDVRRLLGATNEVLRDMAWTRPDIVGYVTVRTGLPLAAWRALNEGISPALPCRNVVRVPVYRGETSMAAVDRWLARGA